VGEPEKFYPSGERTFARLVPADDVQAFGAARWARELGARRAFLVDDKSVEGQGLVEQFAATAERVGLDVAGRKGMDPRADEYRELAREVADERPDLVYFGGGVESNASRLWRDLNAAVPRARLMGSARLLSPGFYQRLGPEAARTYLTSVTQDPSTLPPRGQRFLRDYRRQFGEDPDPYGAYGHAAMSLLLDAIRRAGENANRRDEIVEQVLDTRRFESVVGTFSLDEGGDTTLERFAGYRVRGGRPVFVKSLRGDATS
jgi:branched-chain amino acid transport system substrate-binding protein